MYSSLFNVGTQSPDVLGDQKVKIRMVNVLIIFWYHAFIIMSTLAIIFRPNWVPSIVLNCCGLVWIISCHLLNKKGKLTLAAAGVLLYTMFHYCVITCYFAPERYVEFFYLIVPCISLIFFNRLLYSWIIFGISVVLFHIPFLVFHYYEKEGVLFLPPILIFLFVINFLIVLYFKQLNAKNENLLAEEKKQVEEQHRELEQLSNFKNRFFINLSHEIRTPLTLINGGINKLRGGNKDSTEETIVQLQKNVDSIANLVDDVIDLTKIEEEKLNLNPVPTSVNEFLQKQQGMFESLLAQKNITCSISENQEDVVINIDRVYFERAFNNIIHNAYKYTPEGGKIELGFKSNGKQVSLWVLDNGIGIPQDVLPKIFDHFKQAQNKINEASGSGIGLSFSKHVIEKHGGSIVASSVEGETTTFTITLDVAQEVALPQDEQSTTEAIPVTHTVSDELLYIVDDNKEIREYLVDVFSNYQVETFIDGEKALAALEKKKPSLIISDYMMPEMNGYELVKTMREKGFDVPTIILTARTDKADKMEVLRLGVDDYITKPFNEDEFKLKVHNLLTHNKERLAFIAEDNTEENHEAQPTQDSFLQLLNEKITNNLDVKNYEIGDLAESVNVSERTLHRKVKALTGLSPKQYIIALRMEKAKTLLEKGEHSTIKEISLAVGISNQTYFSEQYQRRFGRKP